LTLVVDTGFVVGLMVASDPHHAAARDWFATVDEDLVTSPLAVAEMDRIAAGLGPDFNRGLWEDLRSGAYAVRWWADALGETIAIARRQPSLGLTDASIAAVAQRVGTTRIATFDTHFRSVTTPGREPFKLLPADA
jgi:predicted nucleic acid-binding protein